MRVVRAVLIAVLPLAPGVSYAQTTAPAPSDVQYFVDVSLSGTAQSLSLGREFAARFIRFGEIGTSRAVYPKPSRALLLPFAELGGGVMFERIVGLGASYSRTVYEDAVNLDATIPHPLFLNASVSGFSVTPEAFKRRETAFNIFVALVPLRIGRTEVRVLAGPSFFSYRADMVREVVYTQTSDVATPVSTLTIDGALSDEVSAKTVGIHASGDFTFYVNSRIGVVGGVRYSRGTVTIDREPLSALQQSIRIGSTLVFAGVRFRFGG